MVYTYWYNVRNFDLHTNEADDVEEVSMRNVTFTSSLLNPDGPISTTFSWVMSNFRNYLFLFWYFLSGLLRPPEAKVRQIRAKMMVHTESMLLYTSIPGLNNCLKYNVNVF